MPIDYYFAIRRLPPRHFAAADRAPRERQREPRFRRRDATAARAALITLSLADARRRFSDAIAHCRFVYLIGYRRRFAIIRFPF